MISERVELNRAHFFNDISSLSFHVDFCVFFINFFCDVRLQPLIKEHADYRPTIDKVNELGRIYDSLISEERASSRMSIKSSPTRSEYTGQQQQLNSHCAQQNGHSNGHGPQPQSNNNSSHPGRPIAGGKNTLAPAAFADETLLTPTQQQQQQQQQHLQLHQQASTLNHNPNNSERVNKAATQPKHHANLAAHASFIKSGRLANLLCLISPKQ